MDLSKKLDNFLKEYSVKTQQRFSVKMKELAPKDKLEEAIDALLDVKPEKKTGKE